jgi:glucosamine kinase
MIAVGTGIVGEAWHGGTDTRMVSGWGYPVGDEGSGAWLGLQAARLAHRALDGRGPRGPLVNAVLQRFGGDLTGASTWLATANQTAYATLAPLVLMHARDDPAARSLLLAAGEEIATIADTLDPQAQLPLALTGGLSEPLKPWLPESLRARLVQPKADAVSGAVQMAHQLLDA